MAKKTKSNPVAALKVVVEERLRALLEHSRAELKAEDADRTHSDVCDNLWDMYVGGEVEAALDEASEIGRIDP